MFSSSFNTFSALCSSVTSWLIVLNMAISVQKGKWGEFEPTNHWNHDGRAAALQVKVREGLGGLAISAGVGPFM
jgi:hypothetical protein